MSRAYPERPILAVSAAIFRAGRVLIVRRAVPPRLYTLPGGVVEAGETLEQAVHREIGEETGLRIALAGFAGLREAILRDAEDRVSRHFVVLAYAANWLDGEPALNAELSEAHWLAPEALTGYETTEGLAEIVAAAARLAG